MKLTDLRIGQQIEMPNRKRVEPFTVTAICSWPGHNTHQGSVYLAGPRGAQRTLLVRLDGGFVLQ